MLAKGCQELRAPAKQRNVGDRFHPQGQSQTRRNTGFAYSSPSFLAQNGAFFCRKEEEFQHNPAGRRGQGDAREAVGWGPKSHAQHKCLATVWEEKPGLGGRFYCIFATRRQWGAADVNRGCSAGVAQLQEALGTACAWL